MNSGSSERMMAENRVAENTMSTDLLFCTQSFLPNQKVSFRESNCNNWFYPKHPPLQFATNAEIFTNNPKFTEHLFGKTELMRNFMENHVETFVLPTSLP